jgi:hypothetical protein
MTGDMSPKEWTLHWNFSFPFGNGYTKFSNDHAMKVTIGFSMGMGKMKEGVQCQLIGSFCAGVHFVQIFTSTLKNALSVVNPER